MKNKKSLFGTAFILIFLMITVVFAQIQGGQSNPTTQPATTPEANIPEGKILRYDLGTALYGQDSNRRAAMLLGEDQKYTLDVSGDLVTLKTKGDATIYLRDEKGAVERTYTGFNRDTETTLVFNKKTKELTKGTNFHIGRTDEGWTDMRVRGTDYFLMDGNHVTFPEESRMQIATDKGIVRPEKVEGYEEKEGDEDFRAEYKTLDKKVHFDDGSDIGVDVQGSLTFKGDTALREKGKPLDYGGLVFKDKEGLDLPKQEDETKILPDVPEGPGYTIPEGSTLIANPDKGIFQLSSGFGKESPIIQIGEDNDFTPYRYRDREKRVFAISTRGIDQSGSAVRVTKGEEGEVPITEFVGNGVQADTDDKHLKVFNDRFYFYKNKAQLVDGTNSLTMATRARFFKVTGEPLYENNMDFFINSHRQFANIPQDYDFDSNNGFYTTPGGNVESPRVKMNYETPEMRKELSTLTSEQLEQTFKDGFSEKMFYEKQEYLYENFNLGTKPIDPQVLPKPIIETTPVQPTQPTEQPTQQPTEDPIPELQEKEPIPQQTENPAEEPIPEPQAPEENCPNCPKPEQQPTQHPTQQPQPTQPTQQPVQPPQKLPVKYPQKALLSRVLKKSGQPTVYNQFYLDENSWNKLIQDKRAGKILSLQEFYNQVKDMGMQTRVTTVFEGVMLFHPTPIKPEELKESMMGAIVDLYQGNTQGIPYKSLDPGLQITKQDVAALQSILGKAVRGGVNYDGTPAYPKGSQIFLKTDNYGNPTVEVWVNTNKDAKGKPVYSNNAQYHTLVNLNSFPANQQESVKQVFNKLYRARVLSRGEDYYGKEFVPIVDLYNQYKQQ